MIGILKGIPLSKKPTEVILDVNGVGYIINITLNTYDKIAGTEKEVFLYTHLVVKEDALDLYGFSDMTEKEMFLLLISISGVGPKLALAILSGISTPRLKEAIMHNHVSTLVAVPGIGKKTAERLIMELRDKVSKLTDTVAGDTGGYTTVKNDAVAALVSLGYKQAQAEKLVNTIYMDNTSVTVEEIIKLALAQLNR